MFLSFYKEDINLLTSERSFLFRKNRFINAVNQLVIRYNEIIKACYERDSELPLTKSKSKKDEIAKYYNSFDSFRKVAQSKINSYNKYFNQELRLEEKK